MSAPVPSCGACTRASSNKAWDCPPHMADGRLFTDYRPRCDINLQYAAPMAGSFDYRQYLIGNGSKIIDANRAAAASVAMCAPCVAPYDQGTMAPDADRVVCDKVSCVRVKPEHPSPFGIGTGRQYGATPQTRRAGARACACSATARSSASFETV